MNFLSRRGISIGIAAGVAERCTSAYLMTLKEGMFAAKATETLEARGVVEDFKCSCRSDEGLSSVSMGWPRNRGSDKETKSRSL